MAKIQQRSVIVGVGHLARELGVSRAAIWRTMQGTLNSARLRRELQARGLRPAAFRLHKRGPRTAKASAAK